MDLPDDPSVIGLARLQGITEDEVVGILVRIWSWFDKNTVDGNARSVTPEWLDRYVRRQNFAADMAAVGWLDIRNGSLVMPHFDRHNSQAAKKRALTNRRVKRSRNADSVTKAFPEKRREEKSIDVASATSCDVPSEPPRAVRPRDEIWDTVAELFHPSPIPKGKQRTAFGRIVQDFRELGATPEAIRERAGRMRAEWGPRGIECTARALAGNWDRFSGNQPHVSDTPDWVMESLGIKRNAS